MSHERRSRLRWLLVVSALACGLLRDSAAHARSQQAATFRASADLLTLTVTVVDGDGRPVTGLSPADFQVTVAGKPAAVSFAEFVGLHESSQRSAGSAAAGSGPVTDDRRTVLILFDDLSYTSDEAIEVRATLPRLLTALDPGDLVGFATTSGLGRAITPTTQRPPVLEALRAVDGRHSVTSGLLFIGIDEALEIDRGFPRETLPRVVKRECAQLSLGPGCDEFVAGQARQIAADARRRLSGQNDSLRRAVDVMGRAGAPRVIVLLSKGVAGEAEPERRRAVFDELQVTAGMAGIHLYALALVGDEADARDNSPERAQARRLSQRVYVDGLKALARAAGGEAFGVIGQPDRFFERVARETSGVYRLGVESKATGPGNTVAIEVTVRRRGVSVRSVGRTRTPESREPAAPPSLEDLFRSGRSTSTLPISVATATRRLSNDLVEVIAEVRSSSQRPPLRLMFGLVDDQGLVVTAGQKSIDAGSMAAGRWLFPLRARPGSFHVRAAGVDDGGAFGLVDDHVEGLGSAGGLMWSDVLVSVPGGGGRMPIVNGVPPGVTPDAQMEVYTLATDWSGQVTVQLMLMTPGGGAPWFESQQLPVHVEERTGVARLDLPALFGTDSSVVLAAVIFVDGKEVGRKSRVLRSAGS